MPVGYSEVEYKSVQDNVYLSLERMWFESLAKNIPKIRAGKSLRDLRGRCKGPVVIVGAGPSVQAFDHLKLLYGVRGHVLTTDRMLSACTQARIVPELSVTVDGSPKIAAFYKSPYSLAVDAVLPVYVHDSIPSLVGGAIYWFVPALEDNWEDPHKTPRSVTRAVLAMVGQSEAGNAFGNSGGFAWTLARYMGHDPIILIGIDFSYGPGVSPVQTPNWDLYMERRGGRRADVIKNDFRYEDNPFGHHILVDKMWDAYRAIFLKAQEGSGIRTINVSPYSTLHGPGIETMGLIEALNTFF